MTKKLREFLPSIMAVLLAMIIGGVIIMLKELIRLLYTKICLSQLFTKQGQDLLL